MQKKTTSATPQNKCNMPNLVVKNAPNDHQGVLDGRCLRLFIVEIKIDVRTDFHECLL
jgi:hypothetical protein